MKQDCIKEISRVHNAIHYVTSFPITVTSNLQNVHSYIRGIQIREPKLTMFAKVLLQFWYQLSIFECKNIYSIRIMSNSR